MWPGDKDVGGEMGMGGEKREWRRGGGNGGGRRHWALILEDSGPGLGSPGLDL